MDFRDCDLIEVTPGKQGGVPLIKGTRIPAQQIVEEVELGSPIEEVADNYSLTREQIRGVIAYAHKHPQPVL